MEAAHTEKRDGGTRVGRLQHGLWLMRKTHVPQSKNWASDVHLRAQDTQSQAIEDGVELFLMQPAGLVINKNTQDPKVSYSLGAWYEIFVITDPQPGPWILEGKSVAAEGQTIDLTVSIVRLQKARALRKDYVERMEGVKNGRS